MSSEAGKKVTRGERMKQILQEHTEVCNGRKQFVYVNCSGDEHRECAGAYSSYLTRAITRDLMHISIFFADVRDAVLDAGLKINQLDDNLMRMLDDRKAGRDLIAFDYEAVTRLIEKMGQIKPAATDNKEATEKITDLLVMAVMRLAYMVKWAGYLETLERIEQFEFDSTVQMFDADGTQQLDGLSDAEIKDIRTLIEFEKKFLLLYLKAESDSEDEQRAYTTALQMELMAKMIAEGKVDDFLAKFRSDGSGMITKSAE